MKLHISHHTTYNYSQQVFLEPHYLSFYPLQRHYYDILEFDININPSPDGLHHLTDTANHLQHQCWFNEPLSRLDIEANILIETKSFNPFSFFIDSNKDQTNRHQFIPFLEKEDSYDAELKNQVLIRKDKSTNTLELVNQLLNWILSDWGHEVRYEEDIHSPSYCFSQKNGSCRDLSWMLIHMLRLCDIPARFISGYSYNDELGEGHELHAWVEFYAPGAGWTGIDPSAGIFTTHLYFPVSSGSNPQDTMPVTGNFRGDATSELSTHVKITEVV